MANIFGNKILWGADLYKGFKIDKNKTLTGQIDDLLPFQMLHMEDKTIDWIKAVADFYETVGWLNVEKKAPKIQRNYMMRNGELNMNEYIVSPDNPYSNAILWVNPQQNYSPLEQFYHLAPNFVDVLRGEFIKRDNTWTVEAIDQFSKDEMFNNKRQEFEQVLLQQAAFEKQAALSEMGIEPEIDPQEYQMQMEQFMKNMTQVELKSRTFRTTGLQWAEKVLKIHEKRYELHELEPDGFESGLITDSEYWHIDLLDDDFRLELINPMWVDHHKGPNVKYVSKGDYFLWFDFMSTGDIVNKFGRKMKEDDILKLKEIYVKTSNIMMSDAQKAYQGAYYDPSKSWLEATNIDRKMNDALLGKELAYNYMRTPNFDHNMDVDILNPVWGRRITGQPQMFRVMRLYWRSLRRIGWLTKVERDGSRLLPTWIDENYKVTVDPVYDTSVVKDKTKDNLLYGEHIDWQWVPEWRHVIKISPNQKHTFWMNSMNMFDSIYIDGAPVKFQFKGKSNPFNSLPPVEGCTFSYINSKPNSFIDRMRPLQVIYNIAMNKVPKKIFKDYGNKVAIDNRTFTTNNLSNDATKGIDPISEYEDRLRESDILTYTIDRESIGLGQPALPTVLPLSTIQEAQLYFQLAQNIKWEAGELVGITRQRLGQNKASETKYGIEQGIVYSETQTEKYFEQHSNLMQRVRQRMLDATQYYSTFNENNRDVYQTSMRENAFLQIEGMENTLPHYNIYLESTANVRQALKDISTLLLQENTLPIKYSDKMEAMITKSIPKILTLVRDGENDLAMREEAQYAADQQQAMQELQVKQQMQEREIASKEGLEREKMESNEKIAVIRALGGIQTDNDADNQLDAAENLRDFIAGQQDRSSKAKLESDKLNIDKQKRVDDMLIQREGMQTDLKKEKIKSDTAKFVAKENKTAAEMKKKAAKKKPK